MQTAVVTNNPDIQPLVPEAFLFVATDGPPVSVLTAARDRIHLGARLLAHPMAGLLRPNETPYRIAVLAQEDGAGGASLDAQSLEIIEYCLAQEGKYETMRRKYDDALLPELRFIGCELFRSILSELGVR